MRVNDRQGLSVVFAHPGPTVGSSLESGFRREQTDGEGPVSGVQSSQDVVLHRVVGSQGPGCRSNKKMKKYNEIFNKTIHITFDLALKIPDKSNACLYIHTT